MDPFYRNLQIYSLLLASFLKWFKSHDLFYLHIISEKTPEESFKTVLSWIIGPENRLEIPDKILIINFHFLLGIPLLFAGNIEMQVQAFVSKNKEKNWTEINSKYTTIQTNTTAIRLFRISWVYLLTRLIILYGYGFYRQWLQSHCFSYGVFFRFDENWYQEPTFFFFLKLIKFKFYYGILNISKHWLLKSILIFFLQMTFIWILSISFKVM